MYPRGPDLGCRDLEVGDGERDEDAVLLSDLLDVAKVLGRSRDSRTESYVPRAGTFAS